MNAYSHEVSLSIAIGATVVVGMGSFAGGESTGDQNASSFTARGTELPLQADAVSLLFRATRTWAVSWSTMHTCLTKDHLT